MGGVEGGLPGVLGPGLGQMPGDLAAAAAGRTGGEVDELVAEGGAAGHGVAGRGQGAQRPGQRVRGEGQVQSGGVGGQRGRGQRGQGSVDQIGEDLLDDGVAAVVGLGLDELERGCR